MFQQRGTVSIAIRAIPSRILGFPDLFLPKVLEKVASEPRGMVLVTGTTGSGKSTTLASVINYINENLTRHIITIEDPIEFLHVDRMSIVSQREISVDAPSFASALRSALRQDPDVILVGEMRDLETVETALLAAETGQMDGEVQKVVVCDLKDNTFYALIYVLRSSETIAIVARPSDAIELALRVRAPIFVDDTVIEHAKTIEVTSDKTDSDRLQKWLESLDPEDLGKYKM